MQKNPYICREKLYFIMYDYNLIIRQSSERVFEVMAPRVSPEDLERIKDAFALAQETLSFIGLKTCKFRRTLN